MLQRTAASKKGSWEGQQFYKDEPSYKSEARFKGNENSGHPCRFCHTLLGVYWTGTKCLSRNRTCTGHNRAELEEKHSTRMTHCSRTAIAHL